MLIALAWTASVQAQGFERLALLPHGAAGTVSPCFVADMDHDGLMEFGMWCKDENSIFEGWEIWKCIPPDSFVMVKQVPDSWGDTTKPGIVPWDVGDGDGDGKTELVGITSSGDPEYRHYVVTVESDDYYTLPLSINWMGVYSTGEAYFSSSFKLADLDNDGKKDIIFLSYGVSAVLVYENVHNDSNRLVWSDTTVFEFGNFVCGDFDCDGLTEFTSGDIDSRFIVWEHTGTDNDYQRVYTGNVEDETATAYDAFGGEDMDADSKPDFFFSVHWGLGTRWYELWHYYATGDNQYAGELIDSTDMGMVGGGERSDIGDVDGDGLLEIVWSQGWRIWLLDDAQHDYERLGEYYTSHWGKSDQTLVTCADLDLDGKDEVLLTGCFRTSVLKWTDSVSVEEPPVTPVTHLNWEVVNPIGHEVELEYWDMPAGFHGIIYDISGKKVDECDINLTSSRIRFGKNVPPGVYYIVADGGEPKIHKVVIIR